MNYEDTICFKHFKIKSLIESSIKAQVVYNNRDLRSALDWLKASKKDAQRMENAIVTKNKRIAFLEGKIEK